jgi:Flp pilus assembly protein CpaB
MTRKTFILIAITSCVSIAAQFSASAVTVPAGTNLTVRTVDTISSQNRVGKKFTAQQICVSTWIEDAVPPGSTTQLITEGLLSTDFLL